LRLKEWRSRIDPRSGKDGLSFSIFPPCKPLRTLRQPWRRWWWRWRRAMAREFMATPHPMIGGVSPLQSAKTDLGVSRVEEILRALEYGLAL
jgi:hypothetical protein